MISMSRSATWAVSAVLVGTLSACAQYPSQPQVYQPPVYQQPAYPQTSYPSGGYQNPQGTEYGRVSNIEVLQPQSRSSNTSGAGAVLGAVVGGVLGNQVGGGSGKKAATVAGAVAGGVIGNQVDKRHVGGKVVNRTERQCHTENATSESSRVTGYNVTYRNPDGTTGTMRMDSKPGTRIAMGTTDKVIGYDVTYRFEGQDKTIRMDQKPGERLPVIDGQVVTQTASVDAPGQG